MPSSRERPGILTLELLFVLPLIIAMLLAMVQFSLLLSARQQVSSAAREAARVAALGGGADEIRLTVDRFLGQDVAYVAATLTNANGDPIHPGEPVEVTVSIPTRVMVPELLGMIGFGLGDARLVSKAVMRRE